ncbi:large-conductance mechanosensitive channel protein MscL [uncultured Phenylobacterium sp.]|uniref:large-conductance mechanosensitive channel protein MscL n=1 Tax=uncultured Phenylobacterium sp. TaxID=349273 RepID=UPI0025F21FCA|nr:large-conductance mechanosensitive channel protein MscL [uncultured Phenylobacterium sp.]
MGMVSEFREFIARGNVVDLAVGVIIGAAFNDIVTVLVDKVIMPPIGMLMSGVDFASLAVVLKPDDPATAANEAVAIQYGALINAGLKFLIVAWVVFMIVKAVNALRRAPPPADEAPPAPPPQEALLMEIRDLLKTR